MENNKLTNDGIILNEVTQDNFKEWANSYKDIYIKKHNLTNKPKFKNTPLGFYRYFKYKLTK